MSYRIWLKIIDKDNNEELYHDQLLGNNESFTEKQFKWLKENGIDLGDLENTELCFDETEITKEQLRLVLHCFVEHHVAKLEEDTYDWDSIDTRYKEIKEERKLEKGEFDSIIDSYKLKVSDTFTILDKLNKLVKDDPEKIKSFGDSHPIFKINYKAYSIGLTYGLNVFYTFGQLDRIWDKDNLEITISGG